MTDFDEINPIIDNNSEENTIKKAVKKLARNSKEIKIASGYFFISGFNIIQDDVPELRDPKVKDNLIDSPFKIIMGPQTDIETRNQLILGYEKEIDKIKDVDDIKRLSNLYKFIKNGLVDVKVYIKKQFHPKLYMFKFKLDSGLTGKKYIVGSSNFTHSGSEGNLELNLFKDNDPSFSYLEKWFDGLWKMSEDFRSDLIKLIKESDVYEKNKELFEEETKFEYLSPLEFFKTIIKIFNKDYLLEKDNILLPFQELDYKLSKDIIQKYGGVIIANSVGLGKSYIASRLVADYFKNKKKILLIIPPNLREQWTGYLKLFKIKLPLNDVISHYALSQKEFPDEKFKDYDLILIDESHNFRNCESNRYKNFMKKIKNNKAEYILLTATPINNSLADLKSQIDILRDENKFRNDELFKLYNSLKSYVKKEDNVFKQDIKNLRRKIIVRTTRRDLKKLYKEIILPGGSKVALKEPKLITHNYSLTGETYKKIYDKVVTFLTNLELPHLKVINPDAGKFLVGLYKILLYKRLESSIYAFYQSLKHLETKEKSFRNLLKKYPISKIREIEDKDMLNKLIKTVGEDEYLLNYMDTGKTNQKDEQTKEQYLNDIENDLKLIGEFIGLVEQLRMSGMKFKDDKIELLRDVISKNKDKKILLFTQFVDTADYLAENLKDMNQKSFVMDKVIGDTKDKIAKVIKFSPSSNKEYISREPTGPFTKFLISTDTLSEGVNLQEADWVINYDLPWNPVRLIQRIGRVHRIGNNKDVFVHNFVPSEDFDKEINLVKTLKKKIKNIIEIIGSEHSLLTLEELEQIKNKEKDDVDIITQKRDLIRQNKLDDLESVEESSKLSEFDKYLLDIIKTHTIKKDELKEIISPSKPIFTTLSGEEKGKFFVYTIDDGVSKSMRYKFMKEKEGLQEEYIPKIDNLISPRKHLLPEDMNDIHIFEKEVLGKEEKERKKSQHEISDERVEALKRRIVSKLNQTRLNNSSNNQFRKKAAQINKINIPEYYFKEVNEHYLKWIKDEKFVQNTKEFLTDFDDLLKTLEKVSQEAIKTKDIKSEMTGFVVYG